MSAKYHWLIAGNVVAAGPKGQVGQKGLNTLVTTVEPFFSRVSLAQAQEGLMQRFIKETPQGQQKAMKIVDVFVLSINNMGQMTQEEFEGSFAADPAQTKLEV